MKTYDATELIFEAEAWLKLQYFCQKAQTEISGFGITDPKNPLKIIDFRLVKQVSSVASTEMDDAGVADFQEECVDEGLHISQCSRIWIHTHPAWSAKPSNVDETCFSKVFSTQNWAVMCILARCGETYARLTKFDAPKMSQIIPVVVDWETLPDLISTGLSFSSEELDRDLATLVKEEKFVYQAKGGKKSVITEPYIGGFPRSEYETVFDWDEPDYDLTYLGLVGGIDDTTGQIHLPAYLDDEDDEELTAHHKYRKNRKKFRKLGNMMRDWEPTEEELSDLQQFIDDRQQEIGERTAMKYDERPVRLLNTDDIPEHLQEYADEVRTITNNVEDDLLRGRARRPVESNFYESGTEIFRTTTDEPPPWSIRNKTTKSPAKSDKEILKELENTIE